MQSKSSRIRQGSLTIFSDVVNEHAEDFKSQPQVLVQIINSALSDTNNPDLQILGIKSISSLIKVTNVNPTLVALFKPLVQQILAVWLILHSLPQTFLLFLLF